MTESELDELLSDCPTLYHMAEEGAWAGISKNGLMSTTALLDHYDVQGDRRNLIESCHRPTSVDLLPDETEVAKVRDQIPMSDGGLLRALPAGLTPSDWYRLLNAKVFFWLTPERLLRLLTAKAYKDQEHDVLEVDSRSLVGAYREKVWLCPINSGCTKPFPHPRDESTFQRIDEYPYETWKKKRKAGERVVELSVDYAVPDIVKFTRRVTRRRGSTELGVIWEKQTPSE